jgi:hypothetical protein
MATPLNPGNAPEDDDLDVDVDLDAMDEVLSRESIGEATTVRIDDVIIHVSHVSEWTSSAMRAASQGDWDTWARSVIEDDDEYQAWMDADLKNYQVEAVFAQCARQARLNAGKSIRPSGSRRRTRKR